MSSEQITQPLVAGEKLSGDEFLRRWELLPSLKRAELIGGVVYLSSPLSRPHGLNERLVSYWLTHYSLFTPGCEAACNVTWLMRKDDVPQPDGYLRVISEHGGQSRVEGLYPAGAPELAAEISVSSAAYDLGPKLELYRAAGVREYVNVLVKEKRVLWRKLGTGRDSRIEPDSDGILRSVIFPGLWLDPAAMLRDDGARLLEVLSQGIASPEHQQFIARLQAARGL